MIITYTRDEMLDGKCKQKKINDKPEQLTAYRQLDNQEQISIKFESQYKFMHENEFEDKVCQMAAILFQPQCSYGAV